MTETPTPPEGDDTPTPAEQLADTTEQARARLEDYHPDDDQAGDDEPADDNDPGEDDTGNG